MIQASNLNNDIWQKKLDKKQAIIDQMIAYGKNETYKNQDKSYQFSYKPAKICYMQEDHFVESKL